MSYTGSAGSIDRLFVAVDSEASPVSVADLGTDAREVPVSVAGDPVVAVVANVSVDDARTAYLDWERPHRVRRTRGHQR